VSLECELLQEQVRQAVRADVPVCDELVEILMPLYAANKQSNQSPYSGIGDRTCSALCTRSESCTA